MNAMPKFYSYFDLLKEHLGGDLSRIFDGKLVYPRQLELHLPGNGKDACNFHCFFCQAAKLRKELVGYEEIALSLIEKLEGQIPWITFGGQYTEPTLNPYLLHFLRMVKRQGSFYGLHTNGSLLESLEISSGFLHELCELSDSPEDYITCSLDAGFAETHSKMKGLKVNWFDTVIDGLRTLVKIRGNRKFPSIRVAYLVNEKNSSPGEIEKVVSIMKEVKPDSLRFSIPYYFYGEDFDKVREYRHSIELPYAEKFYPIIAPYLSDGDRKPQIVWMPPEYQNIEEMHYDQCIYGYYQINIGADGWFYKCTGSASPDLKTCRLGKVTDDLKTFESFIRKNQNPNWKPINCFNQGIRCSRMALGINKAWRDRAV